jgi:hypothetical protein
MAYNLRNRNEQGHLLMDWGGDNDEDMEALREYLRVKIYIVNVKRWEEFYATLEEKTS